MIGFNAQYTSLKMLGRYLRRLPLTKSKVNISVNIFDVFLTHVIDPSSIPCGRFSVSFSLFICLQSSFVIIGRNLSNESDKKTLFVNYRQLIAQLEAERFAMKAQPIELKEALARLARTPKAEDIADLEKDPIFMYYRKANEECHKVIKDSLQAYRDKLDSYLYKIIGGTVAIVSSLLMLLDLQRRPRPPQCTKP